VEQQHVRHFAFSVLKKTSLTCAVSVAAIGLMSGLKESD